MNTIIPTDEEVLLRTAKDAADQYKRDMEIHYANRDAIFSEPIPPPLPVKLRIIAERMGWL